MPMGLENSFLEQNQDKQKQIDEFNKGLLNGSTSAQEIIVPLTSRNPIQLSKQKNHLQTTREIKQKNEQNLLQQAHFI